MRTIAAVAVVIAASFLVMPQFRAGLGTMLAHARDAAYETTFASDAARSVSKAVDAMIGRGTPDSARDDHPSGG